MVKYFRQVVDKIKKHILCSVIFFRNRAVFLFIVDKYGWAIQVTDDNIKMRVRFTYRIIKAKNTDTLS